MADETINVNSVPVGNEIKEAIPAQKLPPEVTLAKFLAETPPDVEVRINDVETYGLGGNIKLPEVLLYCAFCEGLRLFHSGDTPELAQKVWVRKFVTYTCRNCGRRNYIYAISYIVNAFPNGRAWKYGQLPTFGPQIPPRLLRLVQPDTELFLQGTRAEKRGFGIGAFAYYRRVVENQRNFIIW